MSLRSGLMKIELQLVAEPYAAGDTRDSSASDAERLADRVSAIDSSAARVPRLGEVSQSLQLDASY